jgi:RNA 2',3'-cyclic 3'-phosphodiesterase
VGRTRTFLAIDPGKALLERVQRLQQELAEFGANVKWVEPANLHLTLLFLGEVDDRDLVAICRAASEATAAIDEFSFTLEGVGCFPNARRPRVLWVGVEQGKEALIALHGAIEDPLLEMGCYRREARPFTPHLTIGRVNSDDGAGELATALAARNGWKGGEANVREVLVMGSELKSNGPKYTVLGRARLA